MRFDDVSWQVKLGGNEERHTRKRWGWEAGGRDLRKFGFACHFLLTVWLVLVLVQIEHMY